MKSKYPNLDKYNVLIDRRENYNLQIKKIQKEIIFINKELDKIDMDKVYEEQEKWERDL